MMEIAWYAFGAFVLGIGLTVCAFQLRDRAKAKDQAGIERPPRLDEDEKALPRSKPTKVIYRDLPESEMERIKQGRVDQLTLQEVDLARKIEGLQKDVLAAEKRLSMLGTAYDEASARFDTLVVQTREKVRTNLSDMQGEVLGAFTEAFVQVAKTTLEAAEAMKLSVRCTLGEALELLNQFQKESGVMPAPERQIAVKANGP